MALHDVWPSSGLVHHIYILGAVAPLTEFCQVQNSLRVQVTVAFSYVGSVRARHSSSGHQPNFVAWYKEWNAGTFAPRPFRCRERKTSSRISPAGKFTALGKTKTNAFDYVVVVAENGAPFFHTYIRHGGHHVVLPCHIF